MNINEIEIPAIESDVVVEVTETKETFSIKDLLNVIIDFINKLIHFEF